MHDNEIPAKLRVLDIWQPFLGFCDHFHHFCRLSHHSPLFYRKYDFQYSEIMKLFWLWFLFKVGKATEMRRRDPMTSFLPWLDSRWRQKFIRKNMKSSRFIVLQSSGLSPTTLQAHPLGWVARWQTVADDNPRSLASSKSSMPSQDLYSCCCACHTGQCSVETDNVNDSFTLFCRVGISFYKLF